MRGYKLNFLQAQLAMALGHGVRRPWMGESFLLLRYAGSTPPDGHTQEQYALTAEDRAATDWEIA